MRARLILRPGQRGTKQSCAGYEGRVLDVRYRYHEARRKRLKTVELIVDEIDWEPGGTKMRGESLVDTSIYM